MPTVMPGVTALRVVLVLATVAYSVSVLPGMRAVPGHAVVWEVVVGVSVPITVTALCAVRALTSRGDRLAWGLVTAGVGSYAAGTLLFAVWLQPLTDMPYPSVSDVLWLSFYPLTSAGMMLLVRARAVRFSTSMWLDGLIAGLGVAALGAVVVFGRLTADAAGSPAAIVVNFVYPVLDLALAASALGAMGVLGAWRSRTWGLLVAGAVVFATADSWYLAQVTSDTYRAGSPVDATWSVGLCLIGLAATSEQGRAVGAAEIRSFGMPAVFAATSIVVLAADSSLEMSPVSTALAVGALIAAFARTVLAVREVVALADSRRQARHDFLTGLPNRLAIDEMLRGGAAGVRPAGALLLLDLDRFKEINDALGHRTGDQLLTAVARRLSAQVPDGATLSRLGGDEFAVLLPGAGTEDAVLVAADLRARLTDPFTVAGMTLHVDASIGVTATQQGEDAERDLARADLAMYRAKSHGTGVELYDDDRDGDAWNRLALVEDLRDALTAGDLFVELQPIVSLPDRAPAAVEALVRWSHPVRGRLAPDEFLPLVERAGLMWALTRHVLDLALDQAVLLRRAGMPLPVAVNLSASDLLDAGLADVVADALHQRALPGSALHLEITESLLIENRDLCDATLGRLRGLGVQVAVDDFGTGYSSLAYLRDLPVDVLKLDRSFVDQLVDHERTATIVASTITLAHDLGLRVVAEGVETAEQLAWLAEHGCDTVQGYHLGRPMRPELLTDWLATNARERLVRLPHPVGAAVLAR